MLKKKIVFATLGFALVSLAVVLVCDSKIKSASEGKLYNNVASIPFNKVALLLGTGKFLTNGIENPYYRYRIDAASELIKSGRAKYLIVSGDNGRKDYNEPKQMREDLILAGIDSGIIYLDYAGFRTFDSMIRLRDVFGQRSVTVISQPFHNQRAIYIASREGISAIGFNAKDLSKSTGFKIQAREKLARVKVFIDYLFGKKPKFLGEKIDIPS
jgi:SanA protein